MYLDDVQKRSSFRYIKSVMNSQETFNKNNKINSKYHDNNEHTKNDT